MIFPQQYGDARLSELGNAPLNVCAVTKAWCLSFGNFLNMCSAIIFFIPPLQRGIYH